MLVHLIYVALGFCVGVITMGILSINNGENNE